jgi:uncharacterized protein
MKSSETDILIVPGYEGAGPTHWQQRMAGKLSTARVIVQTDWAYTSLTDAVGELVADVQSATRPIVFVAHSTGSTLVAHAIASLVQLGLADRIKGGFLVVPPSELALAEMDKLDPAFAQVPREPLSFPSVLVASSNDAHASLEQSADLALAWGAKLVEAGAQGHIDVASGHGPWPEGMMSFAGYLSRLRP